MNFWAANAAISHKSNLFSRYLNPTMIVKTGSLQDTSASIFWELSPWKASSVLGLSACQTSAVVIEEERDFFCSLLSVLAKEAGLRDPPLTEEEVQRGQSWYKLLSALWLYPCFSECGHQRSFNYGMLKFLPDFLSHSKESSVSGGETWSFSGLIAWTGTRFSG